MNQGDYEQSFVDVEKLGGLVLGDLSESLDLEKGDKNFTKTKEEFKGSSAYTIIDRFLTFHGIIGYTGLILEAVEETKEAIKPRTRADVFAKFVSLCVQQWIELTPDDYWDHVQSNAEALRDFSNYLLEECAE